MVTETIDGRRAVVRHFFKAHEIQVGSRWIGSSGRDAPSVPVMPYNTLISNQTDG